MSTAPSLNSSPSSQHAVSRKTLGENFERWWLIPFASLLVLLAEYSRYLSVTRAGALIFAPRILLVISSLTLIGWRIFSLLKKQDRKRVSMWPLLIVPALLLVSTVLRGLLSVAPETASAALEWAIGFALLMLVALAARPVPGSKWFGTALLVAVLGIVTIGLVEKITDTHLPLSNLHNPYRQQWAITSVFIGQNHLAASLGLLLPLLTGFALAWHGWRRWLSLVTVAAGLVALVFTGSTLTLVALVLAALVFVVIAIYKARPTSRSRVGMVSLAVLLVAVVTWFLTPVEFRERVSIASLGVRQSFDTRIELAKQGIVLSKESSVLGLGPGVASQHVAVTLNNQPTVRALHNLSLEFAVSYGLIACALVLIWLAIVLVRVVRRLPGQGQRWPTAGVLASLAALTIIQAVPSTFEGVRAPFIVLGFALALALRPKPTT